MWGLQDLIDWWALRFGITVFIWKYIYQKKCLTNSVCSYTYLRRQQERGLMQKARRLMDENSVSFQMFLILLYSITLGSESQISVFKQCLSNT